MCILSEDQQALSDCFAGAPVEPGREAFCGAAWHPGPTGLPLIDGAIATPRVHRRRDVLCRRSRPVHRTRQFDSITSSEHAMPLLYYRRRYLRIERAATADVEGKPER